LTAGAGRIIIKTSYYLTLYLTQKIAPIIKTIKHIKMI
jgi:hypothetical protein